MKKTPAYFVYILLCSDGTFYVGKTIDLEKRLRQHNGEIKGGAKYTRSKRPVTLFFFESYTTHKEAAQREYALKQLSHKEKEKLQITKAFLPEEISYN